MKQLTILLLLMLSVGLTDCTKSTSNADEKEQQKAEQISEQESKEQARKAAETHLSFKGVPIDGPLSDYVHKMKAGGFSYLGTQDDGTAVLQGDFAGYKGCTIGVSTLNNADVVNSISVIFPEQRDWSPLEENYQTLKEMLTEKYGQPAECIEKFGGYGKASDNQDKYLRLMSDECTYVVTFENTKGIIQLSLDEHYGRCFVRLEYWDRVNTETVKAAAMDDL